jgi:hypothetical protein
MMLVGVMLLMVGAALRFARFGAPHMLTSTALTPSVTKPMFISKRPGRSFERRRRDRW